MGPKILGTRAWAPIEPHAQQNEGPLSRPRNGKAVPNPRSHHWIKRAPCPKQKCGAAALQFWLVALIGLALLSFRARFFQATPIGKRMSCHDWRLGSVRSWADLFQDLDLSRHDTYVLSPSIWCSAESLENRPVRVW